jgi:hypothetical protein
VHCEAGTGRTGVMIACYGLQQGWDTADAGQEARNFGCSMPDQIAFIQQYRPATRCPPEGQPSTNSGKMFHSTSTQPASIAPSHQYRRADRGREAVLHDAG